MLTNPTLVSTNAAGQGGNGESVFPVFSPSGASLLFLTSASNLVAGADPSGEIAVIKNLSTGAVTLVDASAAGVAGNGQDVFGENMQEFSGDGSQVIFGSSSSNLVAGDTDSAYDIYVKNLISGTISLVSTGAFGKSNGQSYHAAFSPVAGDNRVLFESTGTNLVSGATVSTNQVYIKNLSTGVVDLVSSSSTGLEGNAASQYPVYSPDGPQAVFYSRATNLSPNDADSLNDVFLKNLSTGALSLLSVNAAGIKLNGNSFFPQFSPDGTKIAFFTEATNAGFANPNGVDELMVRDLMTGAITLVSAAADGTPGNANSDAFAWSPDGTQIAFGSGSSNLVAGDANRNFDVFIKTLSTGAIMLASTGTSGEGNGISDRAAFSPDGFTLAFDSGATNFSTVDANGAAFDVFTIGLTSMTRTSLNVSAGTTTTISAVQTYTGKTQISGELDLAAGGSIASSSQVALKASGAVFDVSGASAGGAVTIQELTGVAGATIKLGAGVLSLTETTAATYAGAITDGGVAGGTGGGLVVNGTAPLTLSAADTFTGKTQIYGQLDLAGSAVLNQSKAVTLKSASAVFDISQASGKEAILNLAGVAGSHIYLGGNSLKINDSTAATFSGVISDGGAAGGTDGALIVKGTTSLNLTGANTFTGGVTLQSGVLELGTTTAAGAGGHAFTFAGAATLQLDAGALTAVSSTKSTYGTAVAGFASGDHIDLPSLNYDASATATYNGATLKVTSDGAVVTLMLTGLPATDTFSVSNDGAGHVLVGLVGS